MPVVSQPKSRRRLLFRFVLAGIVIVCIAFIIFGGELLVRFRQAQALDRQISEMEKLVVSNATYNRALFKGYEGRDEDRREHFRLRKAIPRTYRPYIEYRRIPHESDVTNINSLGYRGPEFDVTKKKGVFRILIYGGSFVWGSGAITDRETIAGHLESMMNEGRESEPEFQVINCGEMAYNSTQELVFLLVEGIYLSPDLVIFLDGVNDTGIGYTKFPAGYPFMYDQINRLMVEGRRRPEVFTIDEELEHLKKARSLVWKADGMALIEQLKNLNAPDQPSESSWQEGEFTSAEEFSLRHFMNMRSARGLANEFGFKLGVAIQPNALFYKTLHPQEQQVIEVLRTKSEYFGRHKWWREYYLPYSDTVIQLCQDATIPVLDLRRVYENNDDQIYIDDCHVTGEGYRIIAEALHTWLRDTKMIPTNAADPAPVTLGTPHHETANN